tara:strand:+ start:509 stop:775 length:267 start_codon:yes stop_codon:yes gene_type:complete
MEIKDIKLYTVQCHWADGDSPEILFRTVAIGHPDFLEEDRPYEEWTEDEEEFDCRIFHYYDNYEQLNQHLKDGDETKEDFIVTKIINQ